jgi:hypothetical protein
MPATNAAATVMANAIIGGTYTPFNSANSYIGVGNSTTAFAAGQTDLVGTSVRKAVTGGYPQISGTTLTFQATFVDAEANFAWQEWGVFNAASGGSMLDRKVQSLGTKPNTEQWRITATVTIAGA